MSDPKNITIGLLSVSAALLLTVVLLMNYSTPSASAAMSESRANDYILCSGEIGTGTNLIYVIDVAAQQMVGYGLNLNNRSIDLVPGCTRDLRADFGQPVPGPGGRAPAGGR